MKNDSDGKKSGYPIAIVEDRYQGIYSGGRWVAIARASDPKFGGSLLDDLYKDVERFPSPWSGDTAAMDFWYEPPDFVAVGETAGAALAALKAKGWT